MISLVSVKWFMMFNSVEFFLSIASSVILLEIPVINKYQEAVAGSTQSSLTTYVVILLWTSGNASFWYLPRVSALVKYKLLK